MNNDCHPQEYYEIRVKGHLEPYWSETFDGMQIILTQSGETLLTGAVMDQAALHGLLTRIRDLNLTLISVIRVRAEQSPRPSNFDDRPGNRLSWTDSPGNLEPID